MAGKERDETPIGIRPDGELETIEPGQPIPQPRILVPDGTELTPAQAAEYDPDEDLDDVSDLDDDEEA